MRNFEIPNMNSLPDAPSKSAYQKYQNLLEAWENNTIIPFNTPRPLGAPACGPNWDIVLLKNAFKSTTGITPNMLEWIVESAMEEALARPHPDNLVNLMDDDYKDRYGRTTYRGQFNMIFSYLSGEDNDYQNVQFWFEKIRMVTLLSYNNEDEEVNGEQVRRMATTCWGSTLNRSCATIAPPSRRVSISLSWVGCVGRYYEPWAMYLACSVAMRL
eukprot:5615545-Amphidinium_carterae.4